MKKGNKRKHPAQRGKKQKKLQQKSMKKLPASVRRVKFKKQPLRVSRKTLRGRKLLSAIARKGYRKQKRSKTKLRLPLLSFKKKGRKYSRLTVYRNAKGQFSKYRKAKHGKRVFVARDVFGRIVGRKKVATPTRQILGRGFRLCDIAERSRLVKNVERDLRIAKSSEKDELEKDRIKIFVKLGKRSWQRFDFRRFRNFLLHADKYVDSLFWTPDPVHGICSQQKEIVIGYESEDGDIETEIKRYKVTKEKPEAQEDSEESET